MAETRCKASLTFLFILTSDAPARQRENTQASICTAVFLMQCSVDVTGQSQLALTQKQKSSEAAEATTHRRTL